MHLVHFYFKNAHQNGDGELGLERDDDRISKWTLLPAGPSSLELLRLIATACGGTSLFSRLPLAWQSLWQNTARPLQVEYTLGLHPASAHGGRPVGLQGSGIRTEEKGLIRSLRREEYRFLSCFIPRHRARTGLGNSWLFVLGYGPELKHHDATDDFDFTDPLFRVTHFHSLFVDQAPLTDPVEFLGRVHYRGVRHKRLAPTHVLERLSRLLQEYLAIDTTSWMELECDFRWQWLSLALWQQRAALPVIDAARHLLGAYQQHSEPLNIPGLILFDRPDQICTKELFPRWARLMNLMFPETQFLITVEDQARTVFPRELLARTCKLPTPTEQPLKPPGRAPKGAILLFDIDSRLPNLAIMKLGRYFKEQGRQVILARHKALMTRVEAVYASAVFSRPTTQSRVERLQKYYGDALIVGGSGVDVGKRLPEEIEKLPADYTLYPELGDRAIGFLTRGCPFHCPFCIVPVKEGQPRQVADLDELLPNGERKLVLLDDNILAHPRAGDFLEEMAVKNLKVNFTQSLDLRLLDQEKVQLLKRIHCSNQRFTRRVVHFSLNNNRNLDEVRRQYEMFGFIAKDNVEFICMYGFDTTLAEDVERFRVLRSLPGAYVFVQEYQPIPGGPPADLANFFDERADELVDELTRIMFPQNMKSMEQYYRWVSKHYARTFGRLNHGLVDTIFRYNNRQRRGLYIATMANLCGHKALSTATAQ
jgi:hypothetical protein